MGMFRSDQLAGGRGKFDEGTIALAREVIRKGMQAVLPLQKATGIDTTLGVVGYPLAAPSKKLYPVLSPIRNMIPRVPVTQWSAGGMAGTAAHWKQISAINAANVWGSVGEGARNSVITYTEADKTATFKSFGLDDNITDESTWAGRGFEDVRALSALAVLQATMIDEEDLDLGGNITALGAPATPTATVPQLATDSNANGVLGVLTDSTAYHIRVSALTRQGLKSGAKGRIGGVDALGESTPSGEVVITTGADGAAGDNVASFDWAATRGAFAYNVYAHTSATVTYVATVYTNHYDLGTIAGNGTGVVNVADKTGNALDYDGLVAQIEASGAGYWKDMAGAGLTSDGAEGIVEIDAALQSLWDNQRVGVDRIWCNSQEMKNLKIKTANAGSSSLARVVIPAGSDSQANLTAGSRVVNYINAYTDEVIPIKVHPFVPPGKLIGLCHRIPEWFPNNGIGDPIEMITLQEYADYDFARTARATPHGVYASGVLAMYAPAFNFTLTCIANK